MDMLEGGRGCGPGVVAVFVLCTSCQLPPMDAATAGYSDEEAPVGEETVEAEAPTELVGSWQAGDELIEFRTDGAMLVSGVMHNYSVAGTNLIVDGPAGTVVFPFQLSSEGLVIAFPDGPVTYHRAAATGVAPEAVSGAPVVEAPMDASAAAPPEASHAAGTDQTLVGKWCYVANVTANDGGRQSETCFILNSNGTYQYHSESSSSNPYGSAWSQADDIGTWQSTPSSLIARSSTGRVFTYRLERRNHPQNNDPMLVVDGQTFLTFYQKPPW